MLYRARVTVTLRPSILDPQGKATHHALSNLGFGQVQQVRVGKLIDMVIEESGSEAAKTAARTACEKLLANPVMEDFTVEVEPAD